MKKIVQNSFGKGLNMDLNPLTTPKDVLTDCLNGTIITYNGDEFSLQTEMGNSRVIVNGDSGTDPNAMPAGFIPLGVKEFNNILYIVAHNPVTKESRVGSFPSPQRYTPMHNNDTENAVKISIPDSEEATLAALADTTFISHGMNTLTSYLKRGDRYKVIIKMGNENTLWEEANDILQNFINNYGTGGLGYFDLKYYTYNSDGIYTELPININPGNNSSEIKYIPEPTGAPVYLNGVTQVNKANGNSVIVAALIPKTIEEFDFILRGDNTGHRGAKVIFESGLINDDNSAIKVTTIKVVTSNTEFNDVSENYYDYSLQSGVLIKKLVDNVEEDFDIGTVITVTCTPIDQFGRELTSFAVTKNYTVTDLLLGTDAHSIFRYKIVGTDLIINYNFLNDASGITDTQIEFYDFWSGVSIVSDLIPFDAPPSREVTVTFPLTSAYPKTQVFNSIEKGGIPTTSLTTATGNIMGTYITDTDIRANHCYLVRIFGIDQTGSVDKDLSIFQLLYTLPIAEFVNNYNVILNFGTLDITNGIASDSLLSTYNGSIFEEESIIFPIQNPTIKEEYSNYTRIGGTTAEAYRLYGGPVFEEERDGQIATWKNGNRYYRNIYTTGFEKETLSLSTLGYHNFPESTIHDMMNVDSPTGTSLPNTLFGGGSKYYLKGGLVAPGTYSQKDFRFNITASMSVTAPVLAGTVTISPETGVGPVFFGSIDMSSLSKRLVLGTYTSNLVTNLNTVLDLPHELISEGLNWSTTITNPGIPKHSSKLKAELISGDTQDNFYIRDFELNSERFTYANSAFKYYIHRAPKNKLFSYFALNHVQTVKVKLDNISDYNDVTKHQEYLFSGSIDSNVDVEFSSNVSSRYSIVTKFPVPPPLDAQLVWTTAVGAFDLNAFINTAGSDNTNLLPNVEVYLNDKASKNNDIKIKFYRDAYYQGQDMYSTFKTKMPVQYKVNAPGNTHLQTYNNMWRWGIPLNDSDSYVAVEDAISREYLNNLIMHQSYQELVLAQYPKDNEVHNTSSTTSITVAANSLEYVTSTYTSKGDRHLTKSCFGSGTMEPFTINKFYSIIKKWQDLNTLTAKTVYNFVDIDISEGYAKNIPWNFTSNIICTVPISDMTLSLVAPSPQAHINLFNNAEGAVNSSNYLKNIIAPSTFKMIRNSQVVNVNTSYFTKRNSEAPYNVNASILQMPKLNKEQLLTRSTSIDGAYGITHKLINPPTLDQIYGGFDVKVGEYFGGGVVIRVDSDPVTKKIIGGLIGAVSNGTIIPRYTDASYFYERLSGGDPYTTGATSISDGWSNTKKLLLNARSKDQAVKYCTDYRGGGYSDWYMPSQEELSIFLLLDKTNPAALPSLKSFWSSTEFSWDRAVVCSRLANGTIDVYTYPKNNPIPIIPIRKF